MGARVRAALPALIGFVLFVAALGVLRTELRTVTWHGLMTDLSNIPGWRLASAVLLTFVNYSVLTGYDFLAFAYLGKRLPARRVAMTSFLAYAISNNVGFAMLSGASVRYRFYTRWGVTAEELSRIVFSYVVTFWLGLLLIGGLSLARSALPGELGIPFVSFIAPLG
jgi:phosphatidylglycerol lysyltransferase